MTMELGPHVQMVTLAERLAAFYQKDANLALQPLLSHYMDEVEVNIASDTFNHQGFINRIREALEVTATATVERRSDFLQAIVLALKAREEVMLASSDKALAPVSSA